jgi:SAM-dependent methyltransferase
VDYDELAVAYAVHRRAQPAVLAALEDALDPDARVLEVGCGTGSYAGVLPARVTGLDPSRAMLAVARERFPHLELVQGRAESLPFADESFDLVYSVDVIHHVEDVDAACREAFRAGAGVCIVTDDEETIRARIHRRYFPETLAVELGRYPPLARLHEALRAAGFRDVREQRVEWRSLVTDLGPYRDRALSSLHLISEEAFRRGLASLERDLPLEGVDAKVLLWAWK